MIRKCLLAGLILAIGGHAFAEPIRTALTKENRLPRLYESEVGLEFYYYDFEDGEITTFAPYFRYTLLRDFAANMSLPYHQISPDFGSSESGFGDFTLGFEFVAYKDLFGYPWIMPHAEISFDTGDEDKGLGTGNVDYTVGVAIGTTVSRKFHFVADARYLILDDEDNVPSIAGSIVWDLDAKFSLIAELELSRRKQQDDFGFDDDSHPLVFLGGMSYRANRNLHFTLHGGTSKNSDIDSIIRGRVAYRF